MIAQDAVFLALGFMVLLCVLMPALTRYVIIGGLLMLLADYTVQKATYGSVNLF